MKIFAIFLVVFLFSCSRNSHPSEVVDSSDTIPFPSAAAMSAALGKGINLGNALDAPTEGAWGVTLQSEYFQWVADSGFQTVRIPVRWSTHADSIAPYTIDSAFLARVQWAVDQALSHNLNVIVDMHHYDSLMVHPEREKPRLLAMWKQIAKAFAKYPPELLLEILNEPRDSLTTVGWNDLLVQVIDTIRTVDKRRTLVVGTGAWGGLSGLTALQLPADTNLIVTVHYYEPHKFTHQGASFETGADAWLGTEWRATPAQRSVIDQDMLAIANWGKEHNRPMFLGEFGTYYLVDTVSRAFYTEYMVHRLDSLGISWAAWNFSSDFGVHVDSTNEWHEYLMQALLRPGNNAALDSAVASGVTIDLTKYVLMDDFDSTDSDRGLTYTGHVWSLAHNIPTDSMDAHWYAYYSTTCSLSTTNGVKVTDYLSNTNGVPYDFYNAIGDWGFTKRGLHLKGHLVGESYPYIGFGAGFTGWDSAWHDMKNLTAISFKAKGRGQWWLQLISDSVTNGYTEGNAWGQMGTHITLTEDWQDYVISVDMLAPKQYSPQETDGLTWKDVRNRVNAFELMSGQSYGELPDDSLEIWLDDIHLVGLTPEDLQ